VLFRMSYVTRDFYYGNVEIKTSDPEKKIEVVLKERSEASEPPAVERNDGLIIATCERALSERLQREAETSGVLSFKKEAVRQVYEEMHDCVIRTLRLLRWRTGSMGAPNPIRMGTTNHFVWSVEGSDWKIVADSLNAVLSFKISQLGSGPSSEDMEFIQKGIIEGLNEPLGHELLREAHVNQQSNPRSSLILAVAAAEVGFKHFASKMLPATSWLLALPSPPLVDMLTNFPWSDLKLQINGKVPTVPEMLISELKKAVTLRNAIVHSGVANFSYQSLDSILSSVRDFLYFLDLFQGEGQSWAFRFIRPEVMKQFKKDDL
jgi:hypothetical protein